MKKIIIVLVFFYSLFITDYSLCQWVPNTQWTGIGIYQFDTIGSTIYCANYGYGILKSTNLGVNWISISEGQIPGTAFNVVHNSNFIFVGLYFNGIYRTSNNGFNWTSINNGLPVQNLSIRALIVRGSSIFSANTGISSHGIYKSTNNGDNWYITDTSAHFTYLYEFTNLGQYLFAATTMGIYRTSNEGINWIHMNSPLDSVGAASVYASGNKIYIAGSVGGGTGGVYVSSDYGINWIKLKSQIGCVSVYNNNNIFCGWASDFFVSTNSGVNWVNRNQGLVNSSAVILTAFGYTFLGTGTGGPPWGSVLWRRPLSEILKIKTISLNVPDKYYLYQNYPNPFNPVTNIKYQITNNKLVILKIYNILGKEITTLVNEKQSPGVYEVAFDGSQIPSGVYFYKLETGDFSEVKKMVLIK
ncbi:MAG: T9SS type A sorting domain-containing protein [Ignavibacteriae bacterium]|nr:T9SS type A sorting domain-containing protein [Ignavibacteriota bacterium]